MAYVPSRSPLTGHFNNKVKTKQSFLIHPGTKPQRTCSNENDRKTTKSPIQNGSTNIIKITANGESGAHDKICISKNNVSHPI